MKIVNYVDVTPEEYGHGITKRDVITADEAPTFHMRVFELPPGVGHPPHSHPFEHEVIVLSGQGIWTDGQKEYQTKRGDCMYIASSEKHGVTNNGKEVFRIACLIPVLATCRAEDIEECFPL